jgi:hypothetical protein
MKLSLNQIADIIINNTEGGLKSRSGKTVTREQVKDEIILMRARLIMELIPKGVIDRESLLQEVNCIDIVKKDITECPAAEGCKNVFHAVLPKLLHFPDFNPIQYIGSADSAIPFKVLFGNDHLFARHEKYASKMPTAWINLEDLWIFNEPKATRRLRARFVLEDPRDVKLYSCSNYSDDIDFPSPKTLTDMIIGKLVNEYHRNFSMKNPVMASQTPNHPNK